MCGFAGVAAAAGSDLAGKVAALKAEYNGAITELNAARASDSARDYQPVSLEGLVSQYRLGPVALDNVAQAVSVPHLGRKLAAYGQLARRDVEGTRAAAAVYRLYQIDPDARPAGMWSVAVDIELLPRRVRDVIDGFCGLAFACNVTLYGRIDEVAGERMINFFSDEGGITVMIGLVVDHVQFHPIAP